MKLAQSANSAAEVYETKLRVRYAETDQMGVVYHSNYIIWFEVGRVEMLRSLGFTYREMEKQDGTHIAVVDVRCRFKAPALYDDSIVVRTRLLNVRDSLLHFGYEVLREADGALLAEGETVHLVVDADFKRMPLPEKYRQRFLQAAGKA
jgi:acyl-CoA thioester hydrolase